jgi:hypothetical protein
MFDGNGKAQVSLDSSTPLLQMGKFEIDDTGHVNPLSKDTVLLDGFSGGGRGSTTIRENWLARSCTVPDSDAGTAVVPIPAARKSILSVGMANKEGGADFSRQRPWVVGCFETAHYRAVTLVML